MKRSSNALVGITALSSIMLLAQACSGANKGSGFETQSDGGGGGGDDSGASFGDDGGPTGNFGGDSGGIGSDAACAAAKSKGEQLPLDIYIMLDQSGSMNEMVAGGGTKWTAVSGALKTFVAQPSTGVSVGIQYFGLKTAGGCTPTCNTSADCGANGPCFLGACLGCTAGADSCTASDYAKPEVEIALLPGNATPLTTSIGMHSPTTGTPTSAALQGAVDHAKAWAGAHSGHATIVVFATDGDPSSCDTNLTNIDAIAAAAANGTPKVLTFVIGVGSSLANLNGIAAAGGTMQAFIVDTNQNVNQQFLDALNKIRGTALGCTYKIPLPESGTPDFTTVNVQYVPGNGMGAQVIPQVANKAACPTSGNAWYYDNANAPTQIVLCQATCTAITSDSHGEVDVLTGCKTIVR